MQQVYLARVRVRLLRRTNRATTRQLPTNTSIRGDTGRERMVRGSNGGSPGKNRGEPRLLPMKNRFLLGLSSASIHLPIGLSLLPLLPVLVGNCQGDRKGSLYEVLTS